MATVISEGTILYKVYDGCFKSHSGFLFGRTLHRFGHADGMEDLQHGDTIVLEYGGNVCSYDWQAISECPGGNHAPSTTIEEFCTFFDTLLQRVRTAGGVPVMLTLPPVCERLFFKHISTNRNSENILRWLGGGQHFVGDLQKDYNDALLTIATKNAVPVIDIAPIFRNHSSPESLYEADGIHPNDAGRALIVEAIKRFYF